MANLFDGKVVVISGAGGAIGEAAAVVFAEEGARLILGDKSREQLEKVVTRVKTAGGEAVGITGDITVDADVRALIEAATDHYGRLDCAFNNAGVTLLEDQNWDEAVFRDTLNINLVSQFLCIKYEAEALLKGGGGAIVNMSSVAGLVGIVPPGLPGYIASKHGVIGITKTAALLYARQNIRVNAICPGATRTPMIDEVLAHDEETRNFMLNLAPMGRLAEPVEIAQAAVWLCSDKASFITGQSLAIDGGFTAQ